MRKKVLSAAIVAASVLTIPVGVSAQPTPVLGTAQQTSTPQPARRPLLLMGVKASRPLHGMGTLGTLIPLRPLERTSELNSSDDFVYRGLILEAGGGDEGYELAIGWGRRLSVGAATRVSGDESADRTIFTWGFGFHLGR